MTDAHQGCTFAPATAELTVAAELLRVLADPTHMRLLMALPPDGGYSANLLADILDCSPPSLAASLEALISVDAVTTSTHNRRTFYALANARVRELVVQAVLQAHDSASSEPHPSVAALAAN